MRVSVLEEQTAGNPLVTILMVVRNEEACLEDAIQSVRLQSYRNLELLVIDGQSTDKTVEIARQAALADSRIKILSNEGRTIPTGLNLGLSNSSGTLIARLDGHSSWNSEYLATAVNCLNENLAVAGVGGRRLGYGVGKTGYAISRALSSRIGVGNSVYHYGTVRQYTDHVTSAVYRKKLANRIGGWDEKLIVNEDVDFDHRLRTLGYLLLFEPAMTTSWRVRESFADFFAQYRRYGRGKAQMIRKNGLRAVRARHVAAPGLLIGLVGSSILIARGRTIIGASVPLSYCGVLVVGARGSTATKDGSSGTVRLVLAFLAMHLGWGVGFLENIVMGSAPAASSYIEVNR